MSTLDAAETWLDAAAPAMEAHLAELVELTSHSADPAGCTRVAARLAEQCRELSLGGLEASLVASPSGRFGAHLAVRSRTDDLARAVILVGHHDTVFPAAKFSGFRADAALLRGPGVLDMKGGLVVGAYALGALARAGLLDVLDVRLLSVSDEEVGSPEGRALLERFARGASAGLVLESGRPGDSIITRRKGTGSLHLSITGRAAHAGNAHEDGVNALWVLARFIDRAQGLTDYARGITVNVGRARGGIGKNTVPDEAEADIDLRFIEPADGPALVAGLNDAARAAAASVPGATVHLEGGVSRQPLCRTEASAALLAEYAACAVACGLGAQEAPLSGGGSDANTLHALGVPAIDALGPRGEGYHTLDEHVERASLVPKARALFRFLAGRAQPGVAARR